MAYAGLSFGACVAQDSDDEHNVGSSVWGQDTKALDEDVFAPKEEEEEENNGGIAKPGSVVFKKVCCWGHWAMGLDHCGDACVRAYLPACVPACARMRRGFHPGTS